MVMHVRRCLGRMEYMSIVMIHTLLKHQGKHTFNTHRLCWHTCSAMQKIFKPVTCCNKTTIGVVPSHAPAPTRRALLAMMAGLSSLALQPEESRALTPYQEASRIEYGLTATGYAHTLHHLHIHTTISLKVNTAMQRCSQPQLRIHKLHQRHVCPRMVNTPGGRRIHCRQGVFVGQPQLAQHDHHKLRCSRQQ